MTPLQTLELRMGDLRKQLAELIGATEPDTTAIEANDQRQLVLPVATTIFADHTW